MAGSWGEVPGACCACGGRSAVGAHERGDATRHPDHAGRLHGPVVQDGKRLLCRRSRHDRPLALEPVRNQLRCTALLRWSRPSAARRASSRVAGSRAPTSKSCGLRRARVLTERVEADPSPVLEAWLVEQSAGCDLDLFGLRVWSMATSGASVAAMATRLGMSARQLHRRCLPAFGYGPRHLARVIRFGRALEAIRAGTAMAQVAAFCGYADQAHLTRDVRALTGTTPTGLLRPPYTEGSTAHRSTGRPSGSRTTA